MAETVIFAEQNIGFAYNSAIGTYYAELQPTPSVQLVDGQEYTVIWDGVEYIRTAFLFTEPFQGGSMVAIGNTMYVTGADDGTPFMISNGYNDFLCFMSTETEEEHTVGIYQVVADESTVGIVLKDFEGTEQVYHVEKVKFNTTDGGTQIFSKGEAVEGVPIALDLADGNQTVTAPAGMLVKSAIIQKPDTLTAANIRHGVKIAEVEGEFIGDTEEVVVDGTTDLTFAGGNFEVTPSAETKVISKVTITPPDTLIPANIVNGVEIAGVVGTSEGGGSVDLESDMVKYFAYQLDDEHKELIVCAIFYELYYQDTGSYDIHIPAKIGAYDVVINSEGVT